MKNFLKKVGAFFKDNYWLQPLLLVALVFVLVFGLEGLQSVSDTVKGWFDPYSICKNAERIKANKAQEILESIDSEDDVVYVYYYDKVEYKSATVELNELLNNYIKAYEKDYGEELTVYAVNYAIDEEVSYDPEQTTYKDKTMTLDFYEDIEERISAYYKDELGSEKTFACPVIVKYVYDATENTYKVDDITESEDTDNINALAAWFTK